VSPHVGIVGAGTMGVGVSHAFAASGYRVTLIDETPQVLARARAQLERDARMARLFDAPRSSGPAGELIHYTTDLDCLADIPFIVENVTEDPEIKRPLYATLDRTCPPNCVFGVNTSAIPITEVGSWTTRSDRVIGIHFMNPAYLKPLVEIITGFHTSAEAVKATQEILESIGKESIIVNDSPGFVTNRVMMLTINEAVCLAAEGVASAAEIDRLFVGCFGHRMGPLATADLIGLDTVYNSLMVLLNRFNDPKYRPSTHLKRYVDAGLLGRKSGRGFFCYDL
jgi:3-hydroxybutyryl-CoA dehydrogenase